MGVIKNNNIIIIEDDPSTIYLLRRFVESSHCRAIVATRGETAVTLAEKESPIMIIIGVQLAEIDGCRVLHNLRQNMWTQHIPVILVSNSAEIKCNTTEGVIGHLTIPLLYQNFRTLMTPFL